MRRSVLAEIEKAAADLAYRDDLTGLLNRRLLSGVIEDGWKEIVAAHPRVALVMIDLDGFKAVNDTHGHLAGDAVLRATADLLRGAFRGDDVIVRYGGDEFLVLLLGASAADAARFGERARAAMVSLRDDPRVRDAVTGAPVTFSIGVASVPEDGVTLRGLLAAADRRLFEDKRERRPRRRLRAGWVAVAVAAVAVAVATAVIGLGGRAVPPSQTGLAEGANGAAGRESELLAEIAALRSQLEARQQPQRTPADADAERREVARLQATIGELESELQRRETRAAMPVAFMAAQPTPSPAQATPTPAAVPTGVREPVGPTELVGAERPAGPRLVPPVLLRYDPPRYPEVAERMRREAAVELRIWVDAEGHVTRVEPTGPPVGYGFDEAAREAAWKAVYAPGTADGRPAQMETTLTIRFTLNEPR